MWGDETTLHLKWLQSCPTLCNPRGCSPPDTSVHGILQSRILEWFARPSFRGSSQPRDQTCIPYISWIGSFFTTWEAPDKTTWIHKNCILGEGFDWKKMLKLSLKGRLVSSTGHVIKNIGVQISTCKTKGGIYTSEGAGMLMRRGDQRRQKARKMARWQNVTFSDF